MTTVAMNRSENLLSDKEYDPSKLFEELGVSARIYVGTLFALLGHRDKRVKNRAAKLIAKAAERWPKVVGARIDALDEWVRSDDTIGSWNAMIAVGHVAGCLEDGDGPVNGLLPLLKRRLKDPSMVTAGHAATCLGRIAATQLGLRTKILPSLLRIDSVPRNVECSAILVGKVLATFDVLMPGASESERKKLAGLARRHVDSSRASTRRLARKWVEGT